MDCNYKKKGEAFSRVKNELFERTGSWRFVFLRFDLLKFIQIIVIPVPNQTSGALTSPDFLRNQGSRGQITKVIISRVRILVARVIRSFNVAREVLIPCFFFFLVFKTRLYGSFT